MRSMRLTVYNWFTGTPYLCKDAAALDKLIVFVHLEIPQFYLKGIIQFHIHQ